MIVKVPEYKKLYYNETYTNKNMQLNESNLNRFDLDILDDDEGEELMFSDKVFHPGLLQAMEPKIKRILYQLNIVNFTIKQENNAYDFVVDVNDHLFLPNKHLNSFTQQLFRFGTVKGNCNFAGNNLQDWSLFPSRIEGNCIANFNNIKNFNGAPEILGKVMASKQNKKTDYPLTDENYRLYMEKRFNENFVFSKKYNKFGKLLSIHESNNTCVIEIDNDKKVCKLNEVEYLGTIENLFI